MIRFAVSKATRGSLIPRAMSLEKEKSGAAPAGWPFWDGNNYPDHWPNPTRKQRRVRKLVAYLWVAGLNRKSSELQHFSEKSIHLSITKDTPPLEEGEGISLQEAGVNSLIKC